MPTPKKRANESAVRYGLANAFRRDVNLAIVEALFGRGRIELQLLVERVSAEPPRHGRFLFAGNLARGSGNNGCRVSHRRAPQRIANQKASYTQSVRFKVELV
jgi:hypothetical protein